MPHFITIIKYELIIVKYILVFYYTIPARAVEVPQEGFTKSNPFCSQL